MRVTAIASTVLLALSEFTFAKDIHFQPRGSRWRRNLEEGMRKAAVKMLEGQLERRQSSASNITAITSTSELNATVATACLDGLAGISSVSNQAGITACYNIIQHNIEERVFEADLRLYHAGDASGPFSDIVPGNMMIGVTYPPSTTFESLMKRSLRVVARQTSGMTEMQQYSLRGHFGATMELDKLNQTELMSLMVPEISINAVSAADQKPITTNISSTEMAYFVVGEFQGQFSSSILSPEMQKIAIAASSKFILPGTTFGIFPTGLIVTSTWMVLFCIAFGAGTLGRLRHRKVYRARKAAVGGRVGKRF
jgi:hypothetical protein